MKLAANGTKLQRYLPLILSTWRFGSLGCSSILVQLAWWIKGSHCKQKRIGVCNWWKKLKKCTLQTSSDMLLLQVLEQLFPLPVAWAGGNMDAATNIKQKMSTLLGRHHHHHSTTTSSSSDNNLLPGLLQKKQLRCWRDVKFAWHSNEFLPLFNCFHSHQARNVQRWYLEANADEKTEEYEIFEKRSITEFF